jgi:hypothetical protein
MSPVVQSEGFTPNSGQTSAQFNRRINTQHPITRRALFSELHAAGLWPSFSETPILWKLLADAKRLVEQEAEASKLGGRPES